MPVILCAADLWGTKVNYEVRFDNFPSAAELQLRVESLFTPEHSARRPADVPATQTFQVDRIQTFAERSQQWVDLLTPAQLLDYSQVYVFQKENEYHKEVQSKIPPPVPAPIGASSPPPAAMPVTSQSPAVAAISQPIVPAATTVTAIPPSVAAPTTVVPSVTTAAAASAGLTVPFGEKQQNVFDTMDTTRIRSIGPDEFKAALTRLRIDHSILTVSELFTKADQNRDGVITFDEWSNFTELYPTLLDSLYFRQKDFQNDLQQQAAIEAAKKVLTDLREREKEARMASMELQAASSCQEQKLAMQIAGAQEAQQREKDAKVVLEAAHEDTERGRAELRERIMEQNQQKEKERQKQVAVMEATRDVETVQRRLVLQEAELAKAEEMLREMQRRVAEQRREVETHAAAVEHTRGDVATAQGAEHLAQIMLVESQKDTQACADRVAMAETEVSARQEREREATACHRESQNDTARQLAKRDMEERELAASKEREAAQRVVEDEVIKLVEEQERATQQLENENMELNVSRRQVEEEERPLLDQEVKLREARDSLEEKEARLRNDQRLFHTTHGRGGTAADTTSVIAAAASPARSMIATTYKPPIVPPLTLPTTVPVTAPLPSLATLPHVATALSVSPTGARSLTTLPFEAAPALSALPPPTRGLSPGGRVGLP
eukprot:TRINITY_DN2289_c1_g1_i1.p1 TRINITY_DN2289_c1_g1~~TRINITY_DN2289_c1_g1_i1.p1  ORF type:complete len:669 (+),score=194.78 TRINITY_DN2289_c1_g1_i1:150-2156(+)